MYITWNSGKHLVDALIYSILGPVNKHCFLVLVVYNLKLITVIFFKFIFLETYFC